METFATIPKHFAMTGMWMLVLHPIPLTLLAAIVLLWSIRLSGLWRKHKRVVLLVPLVFYVIDAAIALPRILYAWRSPSAAVVREQIPQPASVVLINAACGKECHARLLSGEIEEVILVRTDRRQPANARPPMRYRVGWSRPGNCPRERERAIGYHAPELVRDGFCPLLEPAEIPAEGIFIISENFLVVASQKATTFTPQYLVDAPPGKTIELKAVEVQRRAPGQVEVLASRRRYLAPGLTGLPPLVGCWARPDNVIWIMPPGDTGCGLWRWFTWGGDRQWQGDVDWIYTAVFTPTSRSVTAPQRPELGPANSAEALEILARVWPVQDFLPGLKEALLAPSVSDEALANLVVQRARGGTLEGSLVDLLATERPAAALTIPARLNRPPSAINQPRLIVSAMERDQTLFDAYREFMFDALSANWWQGMPDPGSRDDPEIGHFIALMQARNSNFLCERLDQVTRKDGILDYRDNVISKNYFDPLPRFLPPLIKAATAQCGDRAIAFMRELLASPVAARREEVARLTALLPTEIAAALAEQAFDNLLDDRGMDHSIYKGADRQRSYLFTHVQILLRTGQSCEEIELDLKAAVMQMRKRGITPPPKVLERLSLLDSRNPARGGNCKPHRRY